MKGQDEYRISRPNEVTILENLKNFHKKYPFENLDIRKLQ